MAALPPREIMEDIAKDRSGVLGILEKGSAPDRAAPQDEHIASAVMEKFQEAQRFRSSVESEWSVFRAVLAGNQDIYRDARTGELVSIVNQKSRRLWSRNNKVNTTNRALIGKVTRSQISFRTKPGPYDPTTIEGCTFADRWLEYVAQKEDLTGKYDEACADLGACAVGYLQAYFDPDAGLKKAHCFSCGFSDMHAAPNVPCPVCQQAVLESIREGDIRVRHLDPFSVYWHPGVLKMSDSPYVFIRHALPVITVRLMFPHLAEFISAEPDIYPSGGIRVSYGSGFRADNTLYDHTFVYEYLERPTPAFEDGRCLKVVSNRLAEAKPGYFDILDRFPIYCFKWSKTPGALYPQPPMADAWHRQRELNENETNSRENSETNSKPKTLIPIGSKMAVDEMTAATAQTILVSPNLIDKVRQLPPSDLSQGHYNRRPELISDIEQMFGVTTTEAGGAVDPNGKVLAIKSAESDQTLGPVVRQHNTELGYLALGLLAFAQKYVPKDTRMYMLGDDALIEGSFSMLNFEPGMSCIVESDDGFSKNQVVRLQEVFNGVQLGLFGAPGTPEFKPWLAAKVARLKIPGLMPDVNSAEYGAANAAIRNIEAGGGFEPGPEDDPGIWSAACMDWLRKRGRVLQKQKPWLVDAVRQMMMYYNQALMFAAQQQAAAQGGGGPPVSNAGAQGVSAPNGTPAPTNGDMSVNDAASQVEGQASADAKTAMGAVGPG